MELQKATLLACSDGAYDTDNGKGSHGWVFASDMEQEIMAGAGPDDGHPSLMTSYRTELGGLLAVLYIIHRICQHYQIKEGRAKCHGDNRGTITNDFSPIRPGITPFLTTDHDLVSLAQGLLQIIPVTVLGEWVKGHYTGMSKEYKHELNHRVNSMATQFQKRQPQRYTTLRKPLTPPDFTVCLLHDHSIITSHLYRVLRDAMHEKPMKDYIMKKTQWSPTVFQKVDWTVHERAFKCLMRNKQISTSKLIHHLANTNQQNHLFYGTSNKFPGCQSFEETFEHVLKCPSPSTTEWRDRCLKELETNLMKISTPSPVLNTILHGFSDWLHLDTGHGRS
jgi:hypothetical protein